MAAGFLALWQRLILVVMLAWNYLLQPMLPSRATTVKKAVYRAPSRNFNPRCPRGQRRAEDNLSAEKYEISTHVALTGNDGNSAQKSGAPCDKLPKSFTDLRNYATEPHPPFHFTINFPIGNPILECDSFGIFLFTWVSHRRACQMEEYLVK